MTEATSTEKLHLFVSCAPGLEPLLCAEIQELLPHREAAARAVDGGVLLDGDVADMMALNLHCSLATRVLLRVASFRATKLPELRRKAARLRWRDLLGPAHKIEVRATCKRSRLYHSGAVVERVAAAIGETVATPTHKVEQKPTLVLTRFIRDRCVISLDTSGEPLHRQGWRQQTAKAPLREDLAAALLRIAQWEVSEPLVDPMAGSGTVAIVAARRAANIAPGADRRFGFERLGIHEQQTWDRLRDDARQAECPLSPGTVFASDRLQGALTAIEGNAKRARVMDGLALKRADLRGFSLPGHVRVVVANPPYGHRVGAQIPALRALGAVLANAPQALRFALVQPARSQLRVIPGTTLATDAALMTDHGGIKVVMLHGSTAQDTDT